MNGGFSFGFNLNPQKRASSKETHPNASSKLQKCLRLAVLEFSTLRLRDGFGPNREPLKLSNAESSHPTAWLLLEGNTATFFAPAPRIGQHLNKPPL